MKMIHRSMNSAELYILKGMLENEGINCTVKNEDLRSLAGKIPFTECFVELWVNKDEDYEHAEQIINKFKEKEATSKFNSWKCKKCGEAIEGQFASCWKCGNNKDCT